MSDERISAWSEAVKFYLPGGKIEPGETGREAVVREIERAERELALSAER